MAGHLQLASASAENFVKQRHVEYPTYFAPTNGISIAYQDFGDPKDETVLLVMGLGGQLIHWHDDFVLGIVDQGYRVIRYDNRDVGLSEKFYTEGTPGLITGLRYKLGFDLGAPYHLDDMADDALGLLDHLKIERAHVVGISMGGMIAQIAAAKAPQRILSLTSIMSTTSDSSLPEGSLEIKSRDREGLSRDQIIDQIMEGTLAIYAKPSNKGDSYWRNRAARGYDRSHYDDGFARQFWAIVDSGDRVELLKTIQQPSLVIHGTIDPLIPIEHGEHTHKLLPNSRYVEIADMGHYIGEEHYQQIISELLKLFSSIDQ